MTSCSFYILFLYGNISFNTKVFKIIIMNCTFKLYMIPISPNMKQQKINVMMLRKRYIVVGTGVDKNSVGATNRGCSDNL